MLRRILKKQVPLIVSAVLIIAGLLLVASIYVPDQIKKSSNLKSITTKAKKTVLRDGPGPMYKQLATFSNSEKLTILKEKHGWLKVRSSIDKKTGWVASWVAEGKANNVSKVTRMTEAKIVLDPGHGGSDPGSLAIDGATDPKYFEKTYTLRTARKIKKALESTGARVIMTRDSDKLLWPLSKISNISKKYHADAFISIHFDNYTVANAATGFTEYYYHKKTTNSYSLAETLKKHFNNLPLSNRGVRSGNFYVIHYTYLPSVLLEMGYLNNSNDFQYIKSASYQEAIAQDVKKGLQDWFDNVQPSLSKTK
ncbi:N-acetylmuramoyl-L-alanine amidase [Oenococcus oeni]|uniref:N-acetylmuramoyl-L-alanine amidase n=1 Tax=Oenococcus oeni TaxID=1247 RepID=UPI00148B2430|nr:N-acetylmuramoyl-L-alanine amidase [Oenococcus oeni]QJU68240.1 N-acetylmuramoyl-L-alanine amidase [Oenococcus oeni]